MILFLKSEKSFKFKYKCGHRLVLRRQVWTQTGIARRANLNMHSFCLECALSRKLLHLLLTDTTLLVSVNLKKAVVLWFWQAIVEFVPHLLMSVDI